MPGDSRGGRREVGRSGAESGGSPSPRARREHEKFRARSAGPGTRRKEESDLRPQATPAWLPEFRRAARAYPHWAFRQEVARINPLLEAAFRDGYGDGGRRCAGRASPAGSPSAILVQSNKREVN